MCGIAGFVGKGSQKDLEAMTETLKARGPDDCGYYCAPGVGLGHRRLSIIDLDPRSRQPMTNEEGSVQVVFNGEIYNYRELKAQLQEHGYRFRTESDTEVIVHAYSKWGTGCFEKFNGMFAIAIVDTREHTLILARDRIGKKPLYYHQNGTTLLFASELKALLAHTHFKKMLDRASAAQFFIFNFIPTPSTLFQHTYKVPPGTYLVVHSGAISEKRYWTPLPAPAPSSLTEACQTLDSLIQDATLRRLIADVPLGVLLSGGIDSSTVAWYAAHSSSLPIKTFSISFEEKQFDESRYAKEVAALLQTHHETYTVHSSEMLTLLHTIPEVMSDPFADASIIPTLALSRFVRSHVTVALGGDGGDELFMGYPTFLAETLYRALPASFIRACAALARALPPTDAYMGLRFKLERMGRALPSLTPAERHQRWLAPFDDEVLHHLLGTAKANEAWMRAKITLASFGDLQLFYLFTYLSDQVLQKVDRASMSFGLEVRAPLLDYRIIEYALGLPRRFKLHTFTPKYILKELMKNRLPRSIIHRSKQGFAVPLAAWFRGPCKQLLTDLLAADEIKKTDLLRAEAVERLMREHMAGTHDHSRGLFTLLIWQMWTHRFLYQHYAK